MTQDIPKTFEIKVEIEDKIKTFVSKKMNIVRRGTFIKKVLRPLADINADDLENENELTEEQKKEILEKFGNKNFDVIGEMYEKILPYFMWEFIKDEDKKDMSKETFIDGLVDSKNVMDFITWCKDKVAETEDFLGKSEEIGTPTPQ